MKEFTAENIVVKNTKDRTTKRHLVSITFISNRKLSLKEILSVTNEAIPLSQFKIMPKRTVQIKYKK